MASTRSPSSDAGTVVLGVLADPVAAPAEIGAHLGTVLATALERLDDGRRWEVHVRYERLPAGEVGSHVEMLEHAARRKDEERWDLVVCVTDLPLRDGKKPLVADLSHDRGLAVLSLPGFGATRLHRRVTDIATELVADLAGGGRAGQVGRAPGSSRDRELPGPFRMVTPAVEGIDARVLASRGRWRLFVGMVRDNRPWRLLFGLRGAIVAAFAFSAFWVVNPTIWQLSDSLSFWRLLLISFGTVVAMVAWLIVYHDLWERAGAEGDVHREHAVLFNASTVATLVIGVGCAHLALLAVNFVAATLVVHGEILSEELGRPAGFVDRVMLTWLATSGASVAGALGTGFESEQSIREAAYSRRERERRARLREESDDAQDRGEADGSA